MVDGPPNRRSFLKLGAALVGGAAAAAQTPLPPRVRARRQGQPNIIFIYADDLGYGDLGCYGSNLPTPNLDTMARQGVLFRNFYSASPVCSPSRAALMTGRYPTRVGVPGVLFPGGPGLSLAETTMAQVLKGGGYATMCIGKWHLGAKPEYVPTSRGFDEYYGLLYSNDMSPLQLMHNTSVIEQPAKLDTLTERYTEEAVSFINRAKDAPFFLYMPHTFPHIPLAASPQFRGRSGLGLYGDAVEEVDWSVGQVLRALQNNGLDQNTLVMFSSDNGPWFQGSPGRLRGRKGDTWEGGMREPFLARFPGQIPEGRVANGIATTMDILPTVARLCGAPLPANPLDGVNIWPMLSGQAETVARDAFLYFDNWNLQCARVGDWKLHVSRYNSPSWAPQPAEGRHNLPLAHPELYNVVEDPEESEDAAADHPGIVASIQARIAALLPTFPEEVQTAWKNTMNSVVGYTPSGDWPSPPAP